MGNFKTTEALKLWHSCTLHFTMFTPNFNPPNPLPLQATYPKPTMQVEQKKRKTATKTTMGILCFMQSIPSMPKLSSYSVHVPMHKGRAPFIHFFILFIFKLYSPYCLPALIPALIFKLKLLVDRNRYAEKRQKLLTNYFLKQETHALLKAVLFSYVVS